MGHKNGNTAAIYTPSGRIYGPTKDNNLWNAKAAAKGAYNIRTGNRFIEFAGVWRLAQVDDNHFSISHKSGYTS